MPKHRGHTGTSGDPTAAHVPKHRQSHGSLDAEMLSQAPPGTIIGTGDGILAWRKTGTRKTDWEKLRPTSEGWRPLQPPESGYRTFLAIVKISQRERLYVFKDEE